MTTETPITSENISDLDSKHISDLVTSIPRLAPAFENLGIDYCCGGKISLVDACKEHNLELEDVHEKMLKALDSQSDERDWSEATIIELIDNIKDIHHAHLREELPRISMLAEKIARVHGPQHAELIEAQEVVEAMVKDLLKHTDDEEDNVFPHCISVVDKSISDANRAALNDELDRLVDEHTSVAERFEKLHELLNDFIPTQEACTSWRMYLDALANFEQELHRHVHKENHVLFPKVSELLATSGAAN